MPTIDDRPANAILAGVRVIDLSDGVAGAFGTKLLAAWGADVIKVEPPGGDPTRFVLPRISSDPEGGILFAYLNTGKRSVVLDSGSRDDRRSLLHLIETAALVVESAAPGAWTERGVDFEALRRSNPSLVVCSVTPFGQDGPRAHWKADALTAFAAGGQMMLCGDEDRPPLKVAGHQAAYQSGLHVFASSLTALLAAERSGVGDRIDISMQEVQAACLEGFGPTAMVRGSDSSRTGNQLRAIWGIYPCADGHVGVAAMARQTPSVYRCIGHPELCDDPAFSNLLANPEMNAVVEMFIGEWAGERTAAEIFDEAGRRRAPFSLIPTPRELLDLDSLRADGFWSELDHPVLGRLTFPGMPFALGEDRGALRRSPLLGEHNAEVLAGLLPAGAAVAGGAILARDPPPPLEGIRVLDLSQVWAGPYAARFLADMGADVIHIEGPSFPDAVRGVGRGDDPRSFNKSPYFNEYNRNKRGVALELKDPRGLEAFKRLVVESDVVLENWSVGVAEGLGIVYEELRAINPRIVFLQMPAYGKTGPDAGRVGFGPAIEQMGGLVALQGYEGGPPHKSGISYGDPNAGVLAAGAVALALLRRERTGEGSHVVLRQRDNIIRMIGEYLLAESAGMPMPTRLANRDPEHAPHGVYRCRDDEGRMQSDLMGNPIRELNDTWLALSVDSDDAWQALARVVGDSRFLDPALTAAAGRKRAEPLIDEVLGEWAAGQEAGEAAAALQAAGVMASPVLSPLMLVRDEHLQARGFYPEYDHPEAGRFKTTRPVWRLAARPFDGVLPAPCFGEHNREVLSTVAGYSAADIEAMEAANVVVTVPLSP
jgi:crotonobetainyl-CoA:carnitine CoA-transferase CaiB-like acyl-CoA transferase